MTFPKDSQPAGYAWHTIRVGTPSELQLIGGGLLTPVPRAPLTLDEWGQALTDAEWDRGLAGMLYTLGPFVPDGFTVVLPVHRFHPVTMDLALAGFRAMVHHTAPGPAIWWWLPVPRARLEPADAASLAHIADAAWIEPLDWDARTLRWAPPRYDEGLKAFVVPSLWMASYAMTATKGDRARMVADLRDLARDAATHDVLVLADTVEAPPHIPLWAELGRATRVGWFDPPIAASDLATIPPGLL